MVCIMLFIIFSIGRRGWRTKTTEAVVICTIISALVRMTIPLKCITSKTFRVERKAMYHQHMSLIQSKVYMVYIFYFIKPPMFVCACIQWMMKKWNLKNRIFITYKPSKRDQIFIFGRKASTEQNSSFLLYNNLR